MMAWNWSPFISPIVSVSSMMLPATLGLFSDRASCICLVFRSEVIINPGRFSLNT